MNSGKSPQSEYCKCAFRLSKYSGLKNGHLNVRSLSNKIDEIRFLIKKINFDILCLTETWLHEKISNTEVKIDGYVLVRRDRGNGKRGGGVCQFIRDTLFFTERCDLNNDLLEAKWRLVVCIDHQIQT